VGGKDATSSGRIDTASAFKILAEAATGRLQKGLTLIQAGTSASGLVPQPGLSRSLRAAFAVVLVLALVGIVLAVAHGYEPPQVPALPHPRGLSASG
jgi:hypothetical protein